MIRYILRRCTSTFVTLFILFTLYFCVVQWLPGAPLDAIFPYHHVHPDVILNESEPIDLSILWSGDASLWQHYLNAFKQTASFEFGYSLSHKTSVQHLLRQRVPISVFLILCSTLLIYLISLPTVTKRKGYSSLPFKRSYVTILRCCYALPPVLLGLVVIMCFMTMPTVINPLNATITTFILPTITLTIGGAVYLCCRYPSYFGNTAHLPYLFTVETKKQHRMDLSYRHIFCRGWIRFFRRLPSLFGPFFVCGTLLIDAIFSLPGLGSLGYQAIIDQDYPTLFGTTYIFTFIGLLISLVSDIMLSLLDPHIRFEVS